MRIWRSFLLALARSVPKIREFVPFSAFFMRRKAYSTLALFFAIWMDYIVHTPNREERSPGAQILPNTAGSARNRDA